MRRLAWLAVVLMACTAQPPTSVVSPSPAPCRLPVIGGTNGQGSGPQQAGFLSLPGGNFAPDQGSAGGSFYDPALKRWVAVGPPALSADGLSYAFFDGGTKPGNLELADVKNGTFRLLATGGPWQVVGVGSDAVYVMQMEYVQSAAFGQLGVSHGLWKVALSGGPPTRLSSDTLNWQWVVDSTVYGAGSTLDVAGGPSPVVRFDGGTGQMKGMWFDSPGTSTHILAVDSGGNGLVLTEGADEEMWRIAANGEPVRVWSGAANGMHPWGPVAVDGSTVWLSSSSSTRAWAIYRYSPATGLRQVALFDHPVTVAGRCA